MCPTFDIVTKTGLNSMPRHNVLTQEQFIADCQRVHGVGVYDYSEAVYVRGRDKIKVNCPKHGPWYPYARKHREGNGCRKCYNEGKQVSVSKMRERFEAAHGRTYGYDFSTYKGAHSSIQIDCPVHGWFSQICEVHANASGCQKCGMNRRAEIRRISFAEYVERSIESFGDRFNIIETSWKGIDGTIDLICHEHGLQTILASSHLKSPTGCYQCSRDARSSRARLTQEEFVSRSTAVHRGRYDYSKAIYTIGDEEVIIICPAHQEFTQKAESHLAGKGCKLCANEENGRRRRELGSKGFFARVKDVHGDRYDLSKAVYSGIYEDLIAICPVHKDFTISAASLVNGRGCIDCGRERTRLARVGSTEQFIEKAKKVHGGKYIYENVEYINAKTPIIITCSKHGEFSQLPDNHLCGNGCSACVNYGFDQSLPAVLYYLKIESNDVIAYKIGVTNRSVAERFYSELDKITVLYSEHFDKGIDALHEEKKILAEYSENKYDGLLLLTSGNTELFVCDVLGLEQ